MRFGPGTCKDCGFLHGSDGCLAGQKGYETVQWALEYIARCDAAGIVPLSDHSLTRSQDEAWQEAEARGLIYFDDQWRIVEIAKSRTSD